MIQLDNTTRAQLKEDPNNWVPFEKQELALKQTAFEILFGGSRGPGKTDAGMAFLLYNVHHPKFRALVIRRNAEDLSDWIDRAIQFYKRAGAVCTGKPAIFTFPSGAVIRTGHLKDKGAYTKYQGHEYQNMLIEEATHISLEENYVKLIASCRSTIKELRPQIFLTANPGEIGHQWIKERFRCGEPDTWYKPFIDPETNRSRVFIHATVDDNPELMEKDPEYVRWLEGLPEGLREQWRFGSWDDYDLKGAIFVKQLNDARDEGRISRVPHDPQLPVDTWWDLGRNDNNVVWFTQRVGKEVRFINYYEDNQGSMKSYLKDVYEIADANNYEVRCHYFPHDLGVHEYTTGETREQSFIDMMEALYDKRVRKGRDYDIVPRVKDKMDAIEAGRNLLPYCWFDAEKCKVGLQYMRRYRFEFDENKNRLKDRPHDDDSEHAADAFMQCAQNLAETYDRPKKQQKDRQRYDMVTGRPI